MQQVPPLRRFYAKIEIKQTCICPCLLLCVFLCAVGCGDERPSDDTAHRMLGGASIPGQGSQGRVEATSATPSADHPKDQILAINHVQALGSHNSYHLASEIPLPAWAYTHLTLDRQLGEQGVRQFELDLYYMPETRRFEVYHLEQFDPLSHCPTLETCITVMKGWSDRNPDHHPFAVLLELKDGYQGQEMPMLEALEMRLESVWPRERLIVPDDVQRDAATVREGLATYGWPKFAQTRGRGLFVLHAGADLRALYTEGGETTADRLLFPDAYGDIHAPYAAFHSINEPFGGADRIRAAVIAGHLVRTRADTDSIEALVLDYSRFEAALESGAHFISTDYPFENTPDRYGILIPRGQPSRCNPLVAPIECSARALEDIGSGPQSRLSDSGHQTHSAQSPR